MPPIPEGVSSEAWLQIGAKVESGYWVVPERNASGEVTAWVTRYPKIKRARQGDRRGLTLRWPLDNYAGSSDTDPILICEGASDTAAAYSIGLTAVGRPSATTGQEELGTLLEHRHVVFVADRDRAGSYGAKRIAQNLVCVCSSVRVIFPPRDANDLRAAVIQGASREDVMQLVGEADLLPEVSTSSCTESTTPITGRNRQGLSDTKRKLQVRSLEGVEPKEVGWVFSGRIPAGMLTLIAGEPGLGKSTMVADLAARVSSGRCLPVPSEQTEMLPGRVIILTAEDDIERVVVPRLLAAGADMAQIETIEGTRVQGDSSDRPFDLELDLHLLEEHVKIHHETRLVIIDPITAYIGTASKHSHNAAVMRSLLAQVKVFCEKTGCAVLVVTHLNKNEGLASPMARVTGSHAVPAAARAVYLVCEDPDDKNRRLLLTAKLNVAAEPKGLAFRLVSEETSSPPRLKWDETPVDMTAREYLRDNSNQKTDRPADEEAQEFLRSQLHEGPVLATRVRQAAEVAGIGQKAINRAAKVLGVVRKPDGFGQEWKWRLPVETSNAQCLPVSDGGSDPHEIPSRQSASSVADDATRSGGG